MPISQSKEVPPVPSSSVDTRELVSRLSFSQPGLEDSTVKAVAEATGKSVDLVRSELQIMRLEKRVSELEARPIVNNETPVFAGRGSLFSFIYAMRGAGAAGIFIMICFGIAAIIFTVFLGIAMIH